MMVAGNAVPGGVGEDAAHDAAQRLLHAQIITDQVSRHSRSGLQSGAGKLIGLLEGRRTRVYAKACKRRSGGFHGSDKKSREINEERFPVMLRKTVNGRG